MSNYNSTYHDHKKGCHPEIAPSHFPCNCSASVRQETQLKGCWEVNEIDNQVPIFASPGQCRLTASGTISYDCQSATADGSIAVRFFRGGPDGILVATYNIDEGSSLSFIAANFNTITISVNQGSTVPAQGEFCITPSFNLSCN